MALVQKYKIKKRPRRESSDGYSIEEIFPDDIGYDGDVEVLRPDQYEEPESEFEDDQALKRLWPDTDEELASRLRRLSCERQSRNAPRDVPQRGQKRRSTEMEADEESPSLFLTEIEVSEVVEAQQPAQPLTKRRKKTGDKAPLGRQGVKKPPHETWTDSSDNTEDAAIESSNSTSARGATNTSSTPLRNGCCEDDTDAMEIG